MLRQVRHLHAGSTEETESTYRNVRHQGDSRLRPYETECLDHPILPYPIPIISYPIETIRVI